MIGEDEGVTLAEGNLKERGKKISREPSQEDN